MDEYDDDNIEQTTGIIPMFKKYWWFLSLILLWIFWKLFFNPGDIEVEKRTILFWWGPLVLGLIILVPHNIFMNRTQKFVWYSGHTTFKGTIHSIKKSNWSVVRKGGVWISGLFFEGRQGAVIFPTDRIRSVGRCAVGLFKTRRIKIENIPEPVQSWLRKEKIPGPYSIALPEKMPELKKAELPYLLTELESVKKENVNMEQAITKNNTFDLSQIGRGKAIHEEAKGEQPPQKNDEY